MTNIITVQTFAFKTKQHYNVAAAKVASDGDDVANEVSGGVTVG